MAVQRFVLDTNELDDANFGLDGPSGRSFILDSSLLDGTDVLDGSPFLTVATGAATLGGLVASASSGVTNLVSASANLGDLIASASALVVHSANLSASLGGLAATANGTVIPPTPPTPPTPEPTPGGGRQYPAPRRKKIQPLPIVEIPIVQPKRSHSSRASARLGGMNCIATASIKFSIQDDDAEVLLLV